MKSATSGLFTFLGLNKAIISSFKYLFQIFLNYDRKSTEGFSIMNVFLDVTGGLLSLIVVLIKYFSSSSSSEFQDIKLAKFLLSIVVLVFDTVLIWQHYVTFSINRRVENKAQKKLLDYKSDDDMLE